MDMETFLLRMTAMKRSMSGSFPMLANSSNTRWTGVGSLPPWSMIAASQSSFTACHMSMAKRKLNVPRVSGIDANTTVFCPASPMASRCSSSSARSSCTLSAIMGRQRVLQLMMIDLRVSPAAVLKRLYALRAKSFDWSAGSRTCSQRTVEVPFVNALEFSSKGFSSPEGTRRLPVSSSWNSRSSGLM